MRLQRKAFHVPAITFLVSYWIFFVLYLCIQPVNAFASTKEPNVNNVTNSSLDVGSSKQLIKRELAVGTKVIKGWEMGSHILKGLVYCIAIILAFAAIYRKFTPKFSTQVGQSELQVLSRLGLGPRSSLIIVQANSQQFLLSQSGETVIFLTEINGFKSGVVSIPTTISDNLKEGSNEPRRANV